MFTIIGGDGKEYGPATVEQIRGWIAGGRANLDTKARAVGSDEWRRLGDYPEFSGEIAPPLMAASAAAVPVAAAIVDSDLAPREMRLVARIVDWIIQSLCMVPGMMLIGVEAFQAIMRAARTGDFDFEGLDMTRLFAGCATLAISMLVLLIVQVWLLSTRGQTIGKILAKVRIVRVVDGSKAGFARAWFFREFLPALVGVIPLIGFFIRVIYIVVDCLFIFREDRRCVHDFIAGTKVVKA